ncbi:MAG: TolC family protein [Nitrospirae bacterium]|nr:TolC family protein [Nitrospirota bacterium]
MKKLFFTLLILSASMPCALSAAEYSLEELYGMALERSETIQIAREDLFISEQNKNKAAAGLMPTLSAFGSHTRYSEDKRSGTTILQPDYSNSWGLKLDQSLSTGGREITSYKMSEDEILKSRKDLVSVKEEYLLSIASAYYEVLKSKKALDIVNSNVERLTKHRDAAKTRLQVGEVTKTVLLRAEAELSGARSDAIKTENNLKLAKAELAKRAGLSGDFDVRENMNSSGWKSLTDGCTLQALDCLKEKALSERSELKALSIERKISESQVSYAKGSFMPTLSLEGVYSRKEDSPSSATATTESKYAVLKLDFPFFEGGLRKAEVMEAKAKLKQSEYRYADAKKSIGLEVENAYLTLMTDSGILTWIEAQVSYASDNYNAVSKQFEHGIANSIDVMDANNLLVTAERDLANARYDYQFAILKLRRATGTLLTTVRSEK